MKADINKGSIISSLNFAGIKNKASLGSPKEMYSEDSDKNSMLRLMIKRSASKVEKLKPGLTHMVGLSSSPRSSRRS